MSKIVSALEDFTVYWCFNVIYRELHRMCSRLREDKATLSVLGYHKCFRKDPSLRW